MTTLRVLLIAEEANPEWVSVPLVGWSHSRALADVADVHLVTQVRNRPAILRAGLVEGEDFTAIDSEAVARHVYAFAERVRGGPGKGWTTVSAFGLPSYYYFERLVWRAFRTRIRSGEFDIVHRLTPLSPTYPSPIAARCRRARVPFCLGPLNGGVPWPKGFDGVRRQEREWLSYVRPAYRLMPAYGATRRNASAIIVASRDTLAQLPARYRDRYVYIPENAIDPARFQRHVPDVPARLPLKLAFVGRLVPYKGPDMLLEAAAPLMREGSVRIEMIGDGPMRSDLEATIEREGLSESVTLHGWVEHTRVQEHLASCDVFAFPSIREFGGGAVLEAMAVGLVPIIVDYAGPAELVTDETGYRVPLGSRAAIIAGFRQLLERLADDPSEIRRRGMRARRRVLEHFTWTVKAEQVLEVWRWIAGQREEKPDFGFPIGGPPAERVIVRDDRATR